MTKREAGRAAHGIVYGLIASAIAAGIASIEDREPAEGLKIEKALDALAQRHFELSDEARKP